MSAKKGVKEELTSYLLREKETGRKIGEELLRGGAVDARRPLVAYPEYRKLMANHAYHRPRAPIGHMALLYPEIVAYVPPIRATDFPAFFGVDLETFVELAYPHDDTQRTVYPIISFPTEYEACWGDLEQILRHHPPTWARWHGALEVTGYDRYFEEARRIVGEDNLTQVANAPDVRRIWSYEYPWLHDHAASGKSVLSKLIRQQIVNNSVDMLLFQHGPKLEELVGSNLRCSFPSPLKFVQELLFFNELYTYPTLLGLGGIPSFHVENYQRVASDPSFSIIAGQGLKQELSPDIMEFLKGVGFKNFPDIISLELIHGFRREGISTELQIAHHKIQSLLEQLNVDIYQLNESGEDFMNSLRRASRAAPDFQEYKGGWRRILGKANWGLVIQGVGTSALGLVFPPLLVVGIVSLVCSVGGVAISTLELEGFWELVYRKYKVNLKDIQKRTRKARKKGDPFLKELVRRNDDLMTVDGWTGEKVDN